MYHISYHEKFTSLHIMIHIDIETSVSCIVVNRAIAQRYTPAIDETT